MLRAAWSPRGLSSPGEFQRLGGRKCCWSHLGVPGSASAEGKFTVLCAERLLNPLKGSESSSLNRGCVAGLEQVGISPSRTGSAPTGHLGMMGAAGNLVGWR